MKKTKLLTSLAALALVVGLGACEVNVDVGGVDVGVDVNPNDSSEDNTGETPSEDNTSENTSEDNTSESTSEGNTSENTSEDDTKENTSEDNTSSVEPPVTSIAELTFIVTLYVDGKADSVPDYGTLYYKGGLNGGPDEDFEDFWNDGDYVALTETTNSKGEVAYTTTFKDVQIREDYDFSLLFYYLDETVGSSYSSHVVASYVSSPLPESGDVGEYEVTLETSLSEKFPDPNTNESRLGLLGEAFKLVRQANYTLTCYSTAVNTDDHMSYTGVVTEVGAISTSYTGSTTGMINDPDGGGFVEVTLDGDVLKASAAPDPSKSVQDYYISSDIDTALFEELEDGRFALKDEGFTSDVLQDLFPDKPFTGGLITPTQGTIFIEVEDDLSKVTYYYDSSFLGTYTVTLVVENLGTTVFPYDLTTQYVGVGSEEVTTWAAFLDSTLKASVDELLGADLDDVLPFFVPDGGYSYTGIWSGKFNLTYSGNADVWVEPLLGFGYTEVTADSEYVLEAEECNYTVTLSSFWGSTDLYLARTEKPAEEDSDLEIAEAILDAVNEGISWDAFHGEYIDEGYDERETVYLTEDEDGMYGSIIDTEDDEVTFAYYYQDGKEYEYAANRNAYEVDDQWEDYSDHLDEYIEEQLDGAEDFDLDSDTYELKEYGDGYELIITTNFMGYYDYEYIYIVDKNFNVTALAYGEYFAGDLEGWYAEETTYDKVAASMEDFDPSDWGDDEMDEEEIALAIIEWAAETDDTEDLPYLWPATHIRYYAMDEDEDIEYWVTSDENDYYYGKVVEQDLEGEYYETRYYLENYYFSEAYSEEDEPEYDYGSYSGEGQYGDEINFVTYPIMDAEGFLDEDDDGELIFADDVSYELTETDDGYRLDIVHGDWWGRDYDCLYTYYTDEDLNVYKTEFIEGSVEEEDYHYNMIELIDYEDVQAQMSDFYDNIGSWFDD